MLVAHIYKYELNVIHIPMNRNFRLRQSREKQALQSREQ